MKNQFLESTSGLKVAALFGGALLAFAASSSISPASAEEGGSEPAKKEAAEIWTTRCVTCHGEQGKGDGPASAGLDPHPRDLSNAEWQKSVTDEHIEKIIKFGGAGVNLSPMMPANPDLMAKPEVVKSLVGKVRSLGSK